MQRQMLWAACALSGLGGLALGVGGTIKALDKEYEQNLAKELENARAAYDRLHKRGIYSDPIALVEAKAEIVELDAVLETVKYGSVFENEPVSEFDLGEEIKKRTADRPYIITQDEFFHNGSEYEQENLNYYDKDGVLATQGDEYIRESDDLVGDENLLRFGEGSGDPNVVYVRNDRLEREYEICRTRGSYAQEVHGILEHSEKKKPKKFRRDDG